jgi:hypothetical protein
MIGHMTAENCATRQLCRNGIPDPPAYAAPSLRLCLESGNDTRAIHAWMWHKNIGHAILYIELPTVQRFGVGGLAMDWSMDRQGIRTLFDDGSKRLKQFELSGPLRERVSLDTYTDALAAREAEFRQQARYGKWSTPGSIVLP